jgi:hypothetical protein
MGKKPMSIGTRIILLGILALGVFSFAVSSQSFWLDELGSIEKAIQPTLAGWHHLMIAQTGSDMQMPLYMIFLWVWEKILGHAEWVMRAAGIPWLIAGLCIFARTRVERWIVVASSAFTWYCLDEARPYAMQLGASLAIFGAIERLTEKNSSATRLSDGTWLAILSAGWIILSGSSLLGMIWAGAAIAAFIGLQSWKRNLELLRNHKLIAGINVCLMISLGVYYLWTVHAGAGASQVGRTDWRNLPFIAYEVSGLSGLGPGRTAFRSGVETLDSYLPSLVPAAIVCGFIATVGVLRLRPRWNNRHGWYLMAVLFGATAFLLGAGIAKHFRVLGRHFTPIAPVAFCILAEGIVALWQSGHFLKRTTAVVFVSICCVSSLTLRLAPRHAKDDYRGAAAVANQALALHQVVWWNAAKGVETIYGVPFADEPAKLIPGEAAIFWNPSREQLAALPRPDVVLMSKPDIFDHNGAMMEFLREYGYERVDQRQAFIIWRRR